MKKLVLSFLSFVFLSSTAFAGEPISGFIYVTPKGECQIVWGTNSKDLTCKAGLDAQSKQGLIVVDFSKLKLRLPPICSVSSMAGVNHDGGLVPIVPLLGKFNTDTVDIHLAGVRSTPKGPVTTLSCVLSDEN